MTIATDLQVQNMVDSRVRPTCEEVRNLLIVINDVISAFDDTYAALTQQSPTWTDTRGGGPPHLLSPSDVLAINTFLHDLQTAISGNAQLPIMLKACVQSVDSR